MQPTDARVVTTAGRESEFAEKVAEKDGPLLDAVVVGTEALSVAPMSAWWVSFPVGFGCGCVDNTCDRDEMDVPAVDSDSDVFDKCGLLTLMTCGVINGFAGRLRDSL